MKAGSFDDSNDFLSLSADFGITNFVLPTFAETNENEGEAYTIGQCQFPINKDEYMCFVNEDSICPKTPTDFPGLYSSTEPCEDPRAPKPRGFWDFGNLFFSFAGVLEIPNVVNGYKLLVLFCRF